MVSIQLQDGEKSFNFLDVSKNSHWREIDSFFCWFKSWNKHSPIMVWFRQIREFIKWFWDYFTNLKKVFYNVVEKRVEPNGVFQVTIVTEKRLSTWQMTKLNVIGFPILELPATKTLKAIIVSFYYETFQRTRKRHHSFVIIGFPIFCSLDNMRKYWTSIIGN